MTKCELNVSLVGYLALNAAITCRAKLVSLKLCCCCGALTAVY